MAIVQYEGRSYNIDFVHTTSIKKENQQVDYVDLRYDTGLAVGWKAAEKKQRA